MKTFARKKTKLAAANDAAEPDMLGCSQEGSQTRSEDAEEPKTRIRSPERRLPAGDSFDQLLAEPAPTHARSGTGSRHSSASFAEQKPGKAQPPPQELAEARDNGSTGQAEGTTSRRCASGCATAATAGAANTPIGNRRAIQRAQPACQRRPVCQRRPAP